MKTFAIVLAVALAAAVPATALAAAPSASSARGCDSLLRGPVECALWALKCIGDALGGNACHGRAPAQPSVAAGPDPEEVVACVGEAVRAFIEGYTPEMCPLGAAAPDAAGPDPKEVVACVRGAVRALVEGYTPMPCPV